MMKKLLVKHVLKKIDFTPKDKEVPFYILYAISVVAFLVVLVLINYFVLG